MSQTTPDHDVDRATAGGGMSPGTIQRIEGGLIVVLTGVGTVAIAPHLWWFPLAVFLLFDVSMLGYVRSPSVGAAWYNAVHTYSWPALLAVVAVLTAESWPTGSMWLALTAMAWGFHVGVDRMLGYGLKLPGAFTHTHLGLIGQHSGRTRGRRTSTAADERPRRHSGR